MNQKIVFIDIDGTLFDNENDTVHQSTIEAITKLKENGIYVCIASGRSLEMGNQVFKKFNLQFDGYVLINGQIVILNNEIIYHNPLDKQFIKEFIEECDNLSISYGFITEDSYIVSSHDESVRRAFGEFKIKLPEISKNKAFKENVYQGLLFDKDILHYFSQKFSQYVRFIPWLGNGADIISKDSSKAEGIKKICEKLKIDQKNIYAIGDSNNDIEMIEYAEVGIAMGNAKDTLKAVSDFVTDDISNDGLAKALKKYGLI